MVVHIDSTMPQAYPLTLVQSRDLLGFCRSVGAAVFTVNFLYVKGEESEERAHAFYRRFRIFSDGERLLESVCGNGFELRESWVLNDESIKAILMETRGNLFAYNVLYLPEDWLFYVGDAIILQVVSHEQEATMRLSKTQYAEFKTLGIAHQQGQPQWSGLPELPMRGTSPR
jgi:hypothetical protein